MHDIALRHDATIFFFIPSAEVVVVEFDAAAVLNVRMSYFCGDDKDYRCHRQRPDIYLHEPLGRTFSPSGYFSV